MIRKSQKYDLGEILNLHSEAFSREAESNLVTDLICENFVLLNLSYYSAKKILGNIIISKIKMYPDIGLICGGVGPLAVSPNYQSKGIGSKLMMAAIDHSKKLSIDALFVVGEPSFYNRFGFKNSQLGSDYSKVFFQELEILEGCLRNAKTKISYAKPFSNL